MFTRAVASARFGARRALSTSTRSAQSSSSARWVVPTSLVAAGLTTYYLTQPLALDAKKPAVKETKKTEEPDVEKKSEEKKSEDTKPEVATNADGDKPTGEGEQQGEQQAAYNPETGEINWDCPCLGGMAHGPCGEEFKEAFSCFVFSEAEPKGFDCIEKFKNMQNCFRKYPEVYSEEIRGEEEPVEDFEIQETAKQIAIADAPGGTVSEVVVEDVVVDVPATKAEAPKTE